MNHPSIYTILKEYEHTTNFSFSFLKGNILKQVKILDTSQVIQESQRIKENCDFCRGNL